MPLTLEWLAEKPVERIAWVLQELPMSSLSIEAALDGKVRASVVRSIRNGQTRALTAENWCPLALWLVSKGLEVEKPRTA